MQRRLFASVMCQITLPPSQAEGVGTSMLVCDRRLGGHPTTPTPSPVIIEFYFKSCRIYSNIGKVRPGPAVGGERGHPGSRALKALPDVQEGHVWTSLARYYRRGCCVVRGGHCCLGEITAEVLMTRL
jgi:hypothetical protein